MSEGGGVCSEAFSRIAVTAVKSGVGSRALGGKWGCSLCWGETSQFFYIGPTWEGPVLFLRQHPRARSLAYVGFRTKLAGIPTSAVRNVPAVVAPDLARARELLLQIDRWPAAGSTSGGPRRQIAASVWNEAAELPGCRVTAVNEMLLHKADGGFLVGQHVEGEKSLRGTPQDGQHPV